MITCPSISTPMPSSGSPTRTLSSPSSTGWLMLMNKNATPQITLAASTNAQSTSTITSFAIKMIPWLISCTIQSFAELTTIDITLSSVKSKHNFILQLLLCTLLVSCTLLISSDSEELVCPQLLLLVQLTITSSLRQITSPINGLSIEIS